MSTYENIDEPFKERVVSHLKGYCSGESAKDGNNNGALPLNLNARNTDSSSHTKTNSKRAIVKQENAGESHTNHSNNLHNLHSAIVVHDHGTNQKGHSSVLPPSPSALSSSSSSSATTSSNSLESSDQLYIPYALLKSKKFKIDHSSINGLNSSYKPSQTVQNFSLSTLKCL